MKLKRAVYLQLVFISFLAGASSFGAPPTEFQEVAAGRSEGETLNNMRLALEAQGRLNKNGIFREWFKLKGSQTYVLLEVSVALASSEKPIVSIQRVTKTLADPSTDSRLDYLYERREGGKFYQPLPTRLLVEPLEAKAPELRLVPHKEDQEALNYHLPDKVPAWIIKDPELTFSSVLSMTWGCAPDFLMTLADHPEAGSAIPRVKAGKTASQTDAAIREAVLKPPRHSKIYQPGNREVVEFIVEVQGSAAAPKVRTFIWGTVALEKGRKPLVNRASRFEYGMESSLLKIDNLDDGTFRRAPFGPKAREANCTVPSFNHIVVGTSRSVPTPVKRSTASGQ